MMRAAAFALSQPRARRGGGWRNMRIIALIVAFALAVSPLGMLGMAEAHAETVAHAETMDGMEMMAMAHCPSQDGENDVNQFDRAADCIKACTGLAVQLPNLQIQLGGAIGTPHPSVSATPHEQPQSADPPPPRHS